MRRNGDSALDEASSISLTIEGKTHPKDRENFNSKKGSPIHSRATEIQKLQRQEGKIQALKSSVYPPSVTFTQMRNASNQTFESQAGLFDDRKKEYLPKVKKSEERSITKLAVDAAIARPLIPIRVNTSVQYEFFPTEVKIGLGGGKTFDLLELTRDCQPTFRLVQQSSRIVLKLRRYAENFVIPDIKKLFIAQASGTESEKTFMLMIHLWSINQSMSNLIGEGFGLQNPTLLLQFSYEKNSRVDMAECLGKLFGKKLNIIPQTAMDCKVHNFYELQLQPRRMSTRANLPASFDSFIFPSAGTKDKILFVYPFGKYSSDSRASKIAVYSQDMLRLKPNVYLNDNLIELKLCLLEESLDYRERERFYFFNTHFFDRLIDCSAGINSGELLDEQALFSWVKEDIFQKEFLVFPINQSLHWYLAVICSPGGCCEQIAPKREQTDMVDLSDISSDGGDSNRSFDAQDTLILIFDSLNYRYRTKLINSLKKFLISYGRRRGDRVNEKKIHARYLNVPTQPNLYDCGCYLVKNVENFVKDADRVYTNVSQCNNTDLWNWYLHLEASRVRDEIYDIVTQFSTEYSDLHPDSSAILISTDEDDVLEISKEEYSSTQATL